MSLCYIFKDHPRIHLIFYSSLWLILWKSPPPSPPFHIAASPKLYDIPLGSVLTTHHLLFNKESLNTMCCYSSTLFANMKAYSRIANSPSRWHFNQYQMWITSLKNQITDNGHSLWFVFFWLVWISIQTISIKFLIICPNQPFHQQIWK